MILTHEVMGQVFKDVENQARDLVADDYFNKFCVSFVDGPFQGHGKCHTNPYWTPFQENGLVKVYAKYTELEDRYYVSRVMIARNLSEFVPHTLIWPANAE